MPNDLNLGIASPRVELLNKLPNVRKDSKKFSFDMAASPELYVYTKQSTLMPVLFMDHTYDEASTLSSFHPTTRIMPIDNRIDDGGSIPTDTGPYILWTPCKVSDPHIAEPGFMLQIEKNWPSYTLEQPRRGVSYSPDYDGPRWKETDVTKHELPDDLSTIKTYFGLLSGKISLEGSSSSEDEESSSSSEDGAEVTSYVTPIQERAKYGMWWGVESSAFLYENMPFWVRIIRKNAPAGTGTYPTFFVISLGIGTTDQRYDIKIDLDGNPQIIDYYTIEEDENKTNNSVIPSNIEMTNQEGARVTNNEPVIIVSVMTIAGRLVVTVNGSMTVYNRVSKDPGSEGQWKEAKIASGSIRIYGTNVQATICAAPMTFAPLSIMSLAIPYKGNTETGTRILSYQNIKNDGTPGGEPVCVLPQDPSHRGKLFGVDSSWFNDINGTINPYGDGFHKQGQVQFVSANETGYNLSALPDTRFYLVRMKPHDVEFPGFSGEVIPNGGAPYFFRIAGLDEYQRSTQSVIATDISDDVISIRETSQAPDYYHVTKSATVTLYNKGGTYNYLRTTQKGIRIYWGWNGGGETPSYNDLTKSFTGIITGVSTNDSPGIEKITLECQDYIYILKNNPIINSPFYDGMIGYYAIKDIAERAGFETIVKDWDNEMDYALPSGYSFSKPKMRFESTKMYFDCIMEIVKRFEAFIYFDEDGEMHVQKLPGGLFSLVSASTPVTKFTINPTGTRPLFDEKEIKYDFNSTVNRISILTVDRDTRNAIVYGTGARGSNNRLAFKKILLIDQGALGDIDVARAWASDLGQRVFYPIRKTSFKTTGDSSQVIQPLSFVAIDGLTFRVLSINREYSAEDNSFTNDYECEWLGGA